MRTLPCALAFMMLSSCCLLNSLDVGCLVGLYIAGQADDFLLGIGQFGDLLVDFVFGAFEDGEFVQYGFIGRVFRCVQLGQTCFFGFKQGNFGFRWPVRLSNAPLDSSGMSREPDCWR